MKSRILHRVNFAQAKFINPVLTHTLSSIFAVAFSPNGKLLATGESTGETHIWRIDDAQQSGTYSIFIQIILEAEFYGF